MYRCYFSDWYWWIVVLVIYSLNVVLITKKWLLVLYKYVVIVNGYGNYCRYV